MMWALVTPASSAVNVAQPWAAFPSLDDALLAMSASMSFLLRCVESVLSSAPVRMPCVSETRTSSRPAGGGNVAGDGVGVDVELAAGGVACDGRDDGDVVGFEQGLDEFGVDAFDFADVADIDAAGGFDAADKRALFIRDFKEKTFAEHHAAAQGGEGHAFVLEAIDFIDDGLVDFGDEDVFRDCEGAIIGVAVALDELHFEAGLLHRLGDALAAAVDDDGLHSRPRP